MVVLVQHIRHWRMISNPRCQLQITLLESKMARSIVDVGYGVSRATGKPAGTPKGRGCGGLVHINPVTAPQHQPWIPGHGVRYHNGTPEYMIR